VMEVAQLSQSFPAGRHRATGGRANSAPLNARPYSTRSSLDNRMAPQRRGPSVLACIRWPGPKVINSLACIFMPPQIGPGRSPMGNETRSVSAGTPTVLVAGR
jgi:hypothetical protein